MDQERPLKTIPTSKRLFVRLNGRLLSRQGRDCSVGVFTQSHSCGPAGADEHAQGPRPAAPSLLPAVGQHPGIRHRFYEFPGTFHFGKTEQLDPQGTWEGRGAGPIVILGWPLAWRSLWTQLGPVEVPRPLHRAQRGCQSGVCCRNWPLPLSPMSKLSRAKSGHTVVEAALSTKLPKPTLGPDPPLPGADLQSRSPEDREMRASETEVDASHWAVLGLCFPSGPEPLEGSPPTTQREDTGPRTRSVQLLPEVTGCPCLQLPAAALEQQEKTSAWTEVPGPPTSGHHSDTVSWMT